jgi:hypothetical protein
MHHHHHPRHRGGAVASILENALSEVDNALSAASAASDASPSSTSAGVIAGAQDPSSTPQGTPDPGTAGPST